MATPRPSLQHFAAANLLAATGGLLDAVVYLNHGHVFANAMTGNVIFLGIAVVTRDWRQVLRHLAPLGAFLLGVVASRRLKAVPHHRGALFVLTLELVALLVLGALPLSFPQLLFTASVAFVSAFQITTFRHLGPFTYNSTFVTGNLRDAGEGAYDAIASPGPADRTLGRRKAWELAAITLAFLLGALLGALAAHRIPTHALWCAEPMLLLALLLTLAEPRPAAPTPC